MRESEIPQGLVPDSPTSLYGAAKAAPFQGRVLRLFSLDWTLWALAPIALACAAIASPWLLAHSPELGLALQRGFSLVCHQNPDRSFFLFGGTVAVCARCLGIYLGAAAGILLRVWRKLAAQLLFAAVTLNLLDWLTELDGLHGNWMFSRLALGFVLGVAGAMMVAASLDTLTPARESLSRAPVAERRNTLGAISFAPE